MTNETILFEADGTQLTAVVGEPVKASDLAEGAMTRTVDGVRYAIYIRFGAQFGARPVTESQPSGAAIRNSVERGHHEPFPVAS